MGIITNAANAAKSALYGNGSNPQSGTEPVSGQTGNGTADAPYDAGNSAACPSYWSGYSLVVGEACSSVARRSGTTGEAMRSSTENLTGQPEIKDETIVSSYDSASAKSGASTVGINSSYSTPSAQLALKTGGKMDDASAPSYGILENREEQSDIPSVSNTGFAQQGGQVNPYYDAERTGVIGTRRTDAQSPSGPLDSANESNAETRGQGRGPVGGVGTVETSVRADPSSGANSEQKLQGANRPGEEPSGEQVTAIRDEKERHENIQAGNDPTGEDIGEGSTKNKDPKDHSGEPLGTVDHGAPGQGKAKAGEVEGPSQEKGTGELWVKSTGFAAYGGDFDAAKPGAGKEAERLLERADFHPSRPGGEAQDLTDAADPLDPVNKPSMADKIKGKLHIGHKS